MQTTTRKTIINNLKKDLEEHLNSSEGYNTDVAEVRSGIYMWEDFKVKPAISIWAYEDEIEEYLMGRNKIRLLSIYLYAFAKTDIISNNNVIYDFMEDIENFLESSHFTYYEDVIIGKTMVYTGGSQDQAAIGLLEIQVRYNQT